MYDRDCKTQPAICGAERQSQVSEQMTRYSMLLDMFEKHVHRLGDKISPILGMSQPCPKDACAHPPQVSLAPHASELRDRNDRMEILSNILNDFVSRIEL